MLRNAFARLILALFMIATLSAAPDTPAAAQEMARTFVGRITGGENIDALIAVLVAPDNTAVAYLCSKDDAWNQQYSKWLTGEMDAQGRLTARANDGTELTANEQGPQLAGTVGNLRWSAELVTSPAGLYRGRAGDEIHAVIQAADGTRVGRVWSVVTGAHAGTWDFSRAQVEQGPGVLRAQRNQPEFIFIELPICLNAFCE